VKADGTIRFKGGCLDVTNGASANGTKIQLWTCLAGDANQQWQPRTDGEIVNPKTGKCLDNLSVASTDNGTDNGTQLDIWGCDPNAVNQRWTLPYPEPVDLVRLVSTFPAPTPLCADDNHGGTADGNTIDIWQCNNGAGAQAWTIEPDGTLRIQGKCMDVKGKGVTNGSLVDLWTCTGATNQQWRVLPDGHIQGTQSGSCLDEHTKTDNGTQLVIWACNPGAANLWNVIPFQNNF
jgi:hypothetical protein